jgi:hypothetical protein
MRFGKAALAALVAAAFGLGLGVGHLQAGSAQTNPSQRGQVLDLARRYLTVTERVRDFVESYPEMIRQSPNECHDAACTQALTAAFDRAAREVAPDYLEAVSQLWADTYTLQELQEAYAFADSASGRAMRERGRTTLPQYTAISVRLHQQIIEARPHECGPGASPQGRNQL